jgi:hypothetical protein
MRMLHYADSDRAKAIREIPQGDETNSLGTKKRIAPTRNGIQTAAQD